MSVSDDKDPKGKQADKVANSTSDKPAEVPFEEKEWVEIELDEAVDAFDFAPFQVSPPAADEAETPSEAENRAIEEEIARLYQDIYRAPSDNKEGILPKFRTLEITDATVEEGLEWLLAHRYPFALIYNEAEAGRLPGLEIARFQTRQGFSVIQYEHAFCISSGAAAFGDNINAKFILTLQELLLEHVVFCAWEKVEGFGYQKNSRVEAIVWALASFYGMPVKEEFPSEQAYRLYRSLVDAELQKRKSQPAPGLR